MSSTKAALKSIKALLQSQKHEEAAQQALSLLASNPNNYQANVFLALALDGKGKLDDAERVYELATGIKPSDAQAWMGLIKVFEKRGCDRISEYQNAALRLAEIYRDADDKYKCQDVIDKFVSFAKAQGSRQQHRSALEVLLPTSPVYEYLEGRLQHPSHTYQTIAQITEFEEKERINREIGERRTRMGAKIGQVTSEVHLMVMRDSPLEDLYQQIIDWTLDDDTRRQYEEKLLLRCYDTLLVLPPGQKAEELAKVRELASDMVIISHPYRLAWDISINWQDHELLQEWDVTVLRQYCEFFPETGLGKILVAYLSSEISPFPKFPKPTPAPIAKSEESSDESEDDEDGGVALSPPLTTQDRLLSMIKGMSEAPQSIVAHRIVGEYYTYMDDHQSVVELMKAGTRLVNEEKARTGLKFRHASEAIKSLFATSLVFYQSPKNHPEAKALFEEILSQNPKSTSAMIGFGLIHEEDEDYSAAIGFLERALVKDRTNIRIRVEKAWCEALNGGYESSIDELQSCLAEMAGQDLRARELRATTQYRIGVCMWNADSSIAARKDRTMAYAYFLSALKSNVNFAPAYTSLGFFYEDYSKDKKRARKCFQKAFELSASEVEAAHRLAKTFAQQGEWDLVENVSQRVVDSGKVRPSPGSKKKGTSWPYAALGVAELNKQYYAKSIVSFQSALRITPDDYHSWVGLGESYHNLGRYIAATKAFQHAETLAEQIEQQKTGETWFAKHMLANVKRELGDYEDAIVGYRTVLETRPKEFGVLIALIQTLVESARSSVGKGMFSEAVQLACEAITAALELATEKHDIFNLWKGIGDACSVISLVQSRIREFPKDDIEKLLKLGDPDEAYKIFYDVDLIGAEIVFSKGLYPSDEEDAVNLTRCVHAAVLSHKRAIFSSSHDVHAQAVAYYNLGWAEHRAHVCLQSGLQKKSTRYLKAAVRCFKRAIELEAGNAEFWNALGIITSELNPKVAQHSFVRSLFLNERSAQTWTNLGTLYLIQNETQLANEAFTRAQATDPDFAHAWAGQGLIALLIGDPREARLLFTHAMEIATTSAPITRRQYALSAFDDLLASTKSSSIVELVQPIFALRQLQATSPNDLPYQHLNALLLERIQDLFPAATILESLSTRLEADYELTESQESLSRFALAKVDLARCQLASGAFREAIQNAEYAMTLSEDGDELKGGAKTRLRLSAHLTAGLANYYDENMEKALEYFHIALQESGGNPDAVCLIAQVLWAKGGDQAREKARNKLFNSIEFHPGHVQSILLLGVIALLDSDSESLEAVGSDLLALRTSADVTDEEQARVGEVLRAIAALAPGEGLDPENEVLTEVKADILLFPDQPHGWSRLADAVGGNAFAADMAVKTATRSAPPRGTLDAQDLAAAFAGVGSIAGAQKAIMITPWKADGWKALGEGMAD